MSPYATDDEFYNYLSKEIIEKLEYLLPSGVDWRRDFMDFSWLKCMDISEL